MENKEKQRTLPQNDSFHLYFSQLSEKLNEGGFTVQIVMSKKPEIQFTPYIVKELLWRTFQEPMTGKKSTTQLTTKEVNQVYKELDKFISENFWFSIPFPSLESLMWEDE